MYLNSFINFCVSNVMIIRFYNIIIITFKVLILSSFNFNIKLVSDVKLVRSNQNKNSSSQSLVEIGILFLMVSIHSFGDVDIINGVNKKSAKNKHKRLGKKNKKENFLELKII